MRTAFDIYMERCQQRWYPLIEHPVQLDLIKAVASGVRFPLVPAGRRSGKTERAKRFVAKVAMRHPGEMFYMAAPTHTQAKKIFWNDMKLFTFAFAHPKRPSESDLIIHLPNESQIHVFGLDRPERMEGIPWTGGVIDEIANVRESAVNENIMPALDTVNPLRPDHLAWGWFIGVPEGLNHYYDMCQLAESNEKSGYKVYHWKSSEILPPEVIAAAKERMSAWQFRQEYEASFETATGRIYDDYGKLNYTDEQIRPDEILHWTHDQNFTPLSSAIGVRRGKDNNDLYFLDEIVLTSAISRQSALEFVEKYKNHQNKVVRLYGDPAGRKGEKHGHESDYTEIERVLRENNWKVDRRVKNKAPAIKDRQNSVRAKVQNANGKRSLFVNTNKAPWCHKGLSTVQYLEGSTYQEDQRNQYQHITTAIGYFCDYEWPIDQDFFSSGITMMR